MIFSRSTFLGLSLREKSILCAEVNCAAESPQVLAGQEFLLDAGVSYAQPDALGKALWQFLKHHGFSSRRAVIGVPAKWLLARGKDIPPATPLATAALLRLQAERDFTTDGKELDFDYAGRGSADAPRSVLVVAMLREQLDRIIAMTDAAGLGVEAITSSSLVLSHGLESTNVDDMVLVLGSGMAEAVVGRPNAPKTLRHISLSGSQSPTATLAIEAQRAMAGLGSAGPDSNGASVRVWDGNGFDESDAQQLSQRTGASVSVVRDFSSLGVAKSENPISAIFAPAVALALAGKDRDMLPVDFLKPRLAPPRKRRFGRTAVMVTLGCAVLIGLITWLALDTRKHRNELTSLQSKFAANKDLEMAKTLQSRLAVAGAWSDQRDPVLECLRELTNVFPEDGKVWATRLQLAEGNRGTLTGRATDKTAALSLLDSMRKRTGFSNVQVQSMRDVGGNSRDVNFSLTFVFTNPK